MMEAVAFFNAMAPPKTKEKQTDWGRRLTVLRIALGEDNASAFAKRISLTPPRWSNVETGGMPIGRDFADKLIAAVPGLSVDWLWYGEKRGLSYDLVMKLAAAELRLAAAESKASVKPRSR